MYENVVKAIRDGKLDVVRQMVGNSSIVVSKIRCDELYRIAIKNNDPTMVHLLAEFSCIRFDTAARKHIDDWRGKTDAVNALLQHAPPDFLTATASGFMVSRSLAAMARSQIDLNHAVNPTVYVDYACTGNPE